MAVAIRDCSRIVLNKEVFFAGASVVKLVGACEEFGSSYLAVSDLRDAEAQPLSLKSETTRIINNADRFMVCGWLIPLAYGTPADGR